MTHNVVKFTIFLIFVSISTSSKSSAQTINPGRVGIGDYAPDIEIKNVINYPQKVIKLSDFDHKLIILDFWATWCSPCVSSFPKLDSLQKKFGSQIQILFVTDEDEIRVGNFLQKMFAIKKILPPTVTNDKSLSKLFKHDYLPHCVWINGSRKIIAITNGEEINESNIRKVLNGGEVSLIQKEEVEKVVRPKGFRNFIFPAIFKANKNSLRLDKLNDSILKMSSMLTGYVQGKSAGWTFDSTLISVQNLAIVSLFKTALVGNGIELINTHSVEVDIPDSALYEKITGTDFIKKKPVTTTVMETLEWKRKNSYCYELKVPVSLAKQKFKIMLDELNRYFQNIYGIEGVVEQRNSKYLALIRTSVNDKLRSLGNKGFVKQDIFSLSIQNQTIKSLLAILAQPLQKFPLVIDETGYTGKIDLQLNCQLSDLNALNSELATYGLKLIEKEKLMNKAVIRMVSVLKPK